MENYNNVSSKQNVENRTRCIEIVGRNVYHGRANGEAGLGANDGWAGGWLCEGC